MMVKTKGCTALEKGTTHTFAGCVKGLSVQLEGWPNTTNKKIKNYIYNMTSWPMEVWPRGPKPCLRTCHATC